MYDENTAFDQFTRYLFHSDFVPVDSINVLFAGYPLTSPAIIKAKPGSWIKLTASVYPQNATNPVVLWQSTEPQWVQIFSRRVSSYFTSS